MKCMVCMERCTSTSSLCMRVKMSRSVIGPSEKISSSLHQTMAEFNSRGKYGKGQSVGKVRDSLYEVNPSPGMSRGFST